MSAFDFRTNAPEAFDAISEQIEQRQNWTQTKKCQHTRTHARIHTPQTQDCPSIRFSNTATSFATQVQDVFPFLTDVPVHCPVTLVSRGLDPRSLFRTRLDPKSSDLDHAERVARGVLRTSQRGVLRRRGVHRGVCRTTHPMRTRLEAARRRNSNRELLSRDHGHRTRVHIEWSSSQLDLSKASLLMLLRCARIFVNLCCVTSDNKTSVTQHGSRDQTRLSKIIKQCNKPTSLCECVCACACS